MKSIKKNFAYETFFQMLMIITPLLTAPYIARVFGAEKTAIYSYTYSVAYYFVIFALLGIENYGNRSIAYVQEDIEKRSIVFSEIFAMQLTTSVTFLILYVLYICIFVTSDKVIAILQLFYVMSAIFNISWFFWGIEEFKITVVRNSVVKLLTVASIFIFVKSKEDLWVYTFIISVSALVSQGTLWFFLPKYINIKISTIKNISNHFKSNLVLFIPVVSLSIYNCLDKVMLGNMSTMLELGYYANADKLINIPMSVITGLGVVMLPRMSKLFNDGKESDIRRYITNSLLVVIFISVALSFGISSIAKEFIPIFFGDGYEPCINITILLAPVILIKAWSNVIQTQYLIPKNKDKEYTFSVIFGAIINVILNCLLIPKLGASGAVVGTLVAELCVAVAYTRYINKYMNIVNVLLKSMLFFANGIIMFFAIKVLEIFIYVNSKVLLMIIEIIISGCIYCILSVITCIIIKFQPYYDVKARIISHFKITSIRKVN